MNISIFKVLLSFKRLVDLLYALIGIAYLQLFIINNFLGPKVELEQSISEVDMIFLRIYSF
jgi:hypothetical protein